jgi:hypothetical protein
MHTVADSVPSLPPAAELRPRPWRLTLAVACAASVGLAGDVILWRALQPDGAAAGAVAGLAVLLFGVLLLLAVCRLARVRLWLLPGGFAVVSRGDGQQPYLVGPITNHPGPSDGPSAA